MGYQESYLTTTNQNDFNVLIDYVKNLGKEYFEERDVKFVVVITLKKDIIFPKGTQFIYLVGDRYYQRNIDELFDNKSPVQVFSCYAENLPSEKIFRGIQMRKGKTENAYAKFEVLKLCS